MARARTTVTHKKTRRLWEITATRRTVGNCGGNEKTMGNHAHCGRDKQPHREKPMGRGPQGQVLREKPTRRSPWKETSGVKPMARSPWVKDNREVFTVEP